MVDKVSKIKLRKFKKSCHKDDDNILILNILCRKSKVLITTQVTSNLIHMYKPKWEILYIVKFAKLEFKRAKKVVKDLFVNGPNE